MFVTSRDNHGQYSSSVKHAVTDELDLHDMFMIVYLLLNLPWMYLSTINAQSKRSRQRRYVSCISQLMRQEHGFRRFPPYDSSAHLAFLST